ncbi:MAG: DUF938 domain-containing protein [Pseudomonadota bacterium]
MTDPRRHAPATERNRDPIVERFREHLPPRGRVLEIGSGTGQHVAYFSAAFPALTWAPSDRHDADFPSISGWIADAGVANVEPPRVIDAASEWGPNLTSDGPWDVVLAINVIHISPIEVMHGLFKGAAAVLDTGPLILYGPYKIDGKHTAPSNEAFDFSLKTQDMRFGIRDIAEADAVAEKNGLRRVAFHQMPANNHLVVYRRPPP